MTNQDQDPHREYRRQTDQHYGRNRPTPRISRPAANTPEPTTERFESGLEQTELHPPLRPSRFGAGMTYSGTGAPPAPTDPPQQATAVTAPMSTDTPTQHIPAPPIETAEQRVMRVAPPPPSDPPLQQSMPITAPPGAGPAVPPPPAPGAPPQQYAMPTVPSPPAAAPGTPIAMPGATQHFELQPAHAMWGLTALAGLATLMSSLGWILVVGGCAYGAWYFGQRGTRWPADIQDLLARVNLAQPAPAVAPGTQPPPVAVIPFRPMSFPEIFTGAFKVVGKQWPTLVGIPLVTLLAAGLILVVIFMIMIEVLITSSDSVFNTAGLGSLIVIFVIIGIVLYAVALPLDALLIALTVITTDKAVRGERIRMAEVFAVARQRMFPVLRLTLGFYTIFIVSDLLAYAVVFAAILSASLVGGLFVVLLFFVANFVLGIMFSFAPIVVITEKCGAIDSFKRSMQLVKRAWGRILGIHLLWMVCVAPILMIPGLTVSFLLGSLGTALFTFAAMALILACTRTLQMLVYTDLRMRQENYEHELIADWTRNTAVS